MSSEQRPYDVYGVGNALVDILAFVDNPFLSNFELPKGGMTLMDPPRQADILHQLEQNELHLASGGSAANTMIGLAQSGGKGFFCGKVAADTHGEFYKRDMEEFGIGFETPMATKDGTPTGTCVVLTTPDAERTLCTHLGVAVGLTTDDIDAEHIAQCKISYIEGYLWDSEGPREACRLAMQTSKEVGTKVAFTVSDAFLIDRFADEFKQAIADYCDILFCNADEARMLCGTDSLEECAKMLGAMAPLVFLTNSEHGCVVIENGAEGVQVDGFKVDAIDTVGAGDAFAGGALYGITNGMSAAQAARWGNFLASHVVSIVGPRLTEKMGDRIGEVVGVSQAE